MSMFSRTNFIYTVVEQKNSRIEEIDKLTEIIMSFELIGIRTIFSLY